MKKHLTVLLLACVAAGVLSAQQLAAVGLVPSQLIVTVEGRQGKDVPVLNKEDFMAYQHRDRLKVSGVIPQQGDHAALELFILIDDSADAEVGLQYDDLKKFIAGQPASTLVGVGYMRNTTVDIAQNLTTEHQKAAAALRIPMGGGGIASPWLSLQELIKRWPVSAVRREVVMITSGVDPLGGYDFTNPYVGIAIEAAQRAGIVVYPIYTSAAGHAGHSRWLINTARNHLAQMAEETGGESYMLGFEEPVSFQPYLTDIAARLTHQYLVTVQMKPQAKASLYEIRFATEVPGAELVAAPRAALPALKH